MKKKSKVETIMENQALTDENIELKSSLRFHRRMHSVFFLIGFSIGGPVVIVITMLSAAL